MHQQIKEHLHQFSEETGMPLPIATFAAQTFQNHWKVQLERAHKSFEKYNQTKP